MHVLYVLYIYNNIYARVLFLYIFIKLSHISLRQDFVACENKLAHKLHLKFIHTIISYKKST